MTGLDKAQQVRRLIQSEFLRLRAERLPAELLGRLYEQFLGPEERKAAGVYYTPAPIVDAIVQRTLGPLCQGRTPTELESLRILDPACGSGCFLLGAYQYLLDWHLQWYTTHDPGAHATGEAPALRSTAEGTWRLTPGVRQRILHSLHGVDIDAQAVEVTRLSLLLKLFEGESEPQEEPRLEHTLRCGNTLKDEDEAAPAFDVVLGNPPYLNIRTLQETAPAEARYYKERYASAARGSYDLYAVFVERGLSLLRPGGRLGYILPSRFFSTDYGEPLRRLLSERRVVREIIDFQHVQLFSAATTYTALLFLSTEPAEHFTYRTVSSIKALSEAAPPTRSLRSETLTAAPWRFGSESTSALLDRLQARSTPLLELPTRMTRGTSTGNDEVFILVRAGSQLRTRDGQPVEVEEALLRTPLYATDYSRYRFQPAASERVLFPYEVGPEGYTLLGEDRLRDEFPKAHAYLTSRREELEQRKQYAAWYGFSAPRGLELHDAAQLLVPLLAERGSATELPPTRREYCLMASGGFSLSLPPTSPLSPRFLLGLLNSKLLFWCLRQLCLGNVFRGGWLPCTQQYVGKLPIRRMDLTRPEDARAHEQIVQAVGTRLELQEALRQTRTSPELNRLHASIVAVEQQLDACVYALYGLNPEDLALLEDTPAGGIPL